MLVGGRLLISHCADFTCVHWTLIARSSIISCWKPLLTHYPPLCHDFPWRPLHWFALQKTLIMCITHLCGRLLSLHSAPSWKQRLGLICYCIGNALHTLPGSGFHAPMLYVLACFLTRDWETYFPVGVPWLFVYIILSMFHFFGPDRTNFQSLGGSGQIMRDKKRITIFKRFYLFNF